MHPINDAAPGLSLLGVVQARAAGRDAAVGADAGHLGKHQRGTAHRPGAQVHQVVVTGQPVNGRVLGHRRDDHAVLQGQPAHREGREHRRRRGLAVSQRQAGALRKPALEAAQPGSVAQAQILMADALAAGQHGVHELRRRQLVAVARAAHLEPFHRIPGRVLQAQHVDAARGLVITQHGGDLRRSMALQVEQPRQLDRILDRQLGA